MAYKLVCEFYTPATIRALTQEAGVLFIVHGCGGRVCAQVLGGRSDGRGGGHGGRDTARPLGDGADVSSTGQRSIPRRRATDGVLFITYRSGTMVSNGGSMYVCVNVSMCVCVFVCQCVNVSMCVCVCYDFMPL